MLCKYAAVLISEQRTLPETKYEYYIIKEMIHHKDVMTLSMTASSTGASRHRKKKILGLKYKHAQDYVQRLQSSFCSNW